MEQRNNKIIIKDIPDKLLNEFVDCIKNMWKKSKMLTFFSLIVLAIVFFFCGKNGLFGGNIEKFLTNISEKKEKTSIQPIINIENISSETININNEKEQTKPKTINKNQPLQKRIILDFNFFIESRQGKLGKTYFSGDEVTFFYKTNCDAYILGCISNCRKKPLTL